MSSRKQFFTSGNSARDLPEFNITLIGPLGVGKSAMTVKYLTRRFIMEYDPSIEDIYTKLDAVDGQDVSVKVMDTADKEDSNSERYTKWSHGYIVVYCITNRPTFDAARTILHSLSQHQRLYNSDFPVALVGNKMDLERYRTVSKATGKLLADEYECSFYECSAAEDFESVQVIFHEMIRDIWRQREGQLPLAPLYISEDRTNSGTSRRSKSNKFNDKHKEENRVGLPRRSATTFKLFNKGFKIFN